MTLLLLSEALRILEDHSQSTQPWDWRAFPIQPGFADNGVVCAFVKPNHDPLGLDFDIASGSHHPLEQLLGLGRPTAKQPRRQPAIATVGNHRQRHIEVHVEADFAGQAVEVDRGEVLEGRKPMKMSRYDGATGRRIAERMYAGI